MASELGLQSKLAKRAGTPRDIGKVPMKKLNSVLPVGMKIAESMVKTRQ
jgi:hypothetical protein